MSARLPAHAPLRRPAAVICDMDGVLVDSEELHWRSVELVLGDLGALARHPAPPPRVGWGDHALWEEFRQTYSLAPSALELTARRAEVAEGLLRAAPPPRVPGALEGLRALKELCPALPMAVASASQRSHMLLSLKEYEGVFDLLVSGLDDCAHNKPAPDVYLLAASRLGVDPAACWVAEDSPTGLRAALAAGARVWRVGAAEGAEVFDSRCAGRLDSLEGWAGLWRGLAP